MFSGTESNVQDPKASLRWNMEQLRVHRAIRDVLDEGGVHTDYVPVEFVHE